MRMGLWQQNTARITANCPVFRITESVNPRTKKWLIAAAKLSVVALLVWGMWATLKTALLEIEKHQHVWHADWKWLVVSGIIYLLGTLPSAVFYQRLLVSAGQHVKLGETLRAYYVSQLGKYVPGKAMVLVLRAGMLRREHVSTTIITAAIFFETFTAMALGALVAAVILLVQFHDSKELLMAGLAALGLFFAIGIPTLPPVFKQIIRLFGVGKLNPHAADKFGQVPYKVLMPGWLGIMCGWCIQGLSLWATIYALGEAKGGPLTDWSIHTAAVTLGVVAGFLTLIPGGFGARELALVYLLKPNYGEAVALVSTIVLRLVWLAAEVILSTALYALRTRGSQSVQPSAEQVAAGP